MVILLLFHFFLQLVNLFTSNKYNCTNKDVIGSKLNKPIGVAVYHPVRQPKGLFYNFYAN